ncbi:MAG: PD40 domain-containing protein [Holophagales bacterium]|nr:PD40 domain-containing protein [Holophagales bacterium]
MTRETGRNSPSAVSNDGKQIALSRRWRPGANQDIWIVSADGGDGVQTTDPSDDDYPHWFGGDRRLGFMSLRRGHRAFFSLDLATGRREDVVADTGRGTTRCASRRTARRSRSTPAAEDDAERLGRRAPGGTPRQITSDTELAAFPCWAPDGTTLAFEAKREEDVHVFTVPATGETPVQLTRGPGQSWPYSFSPDGSKIAFAGLRDGIWNVGWVSRDGKTDRTQTANRRLNTYTSASPPGRRPATPSTTGSPRRPGTYGSSRCHVEGRPGEEAGGKP